MEQRALQDGGGEIRAGARVLIEGRLVGQYFAVFGQPDLVVRRVGVALARKAPVLVAAQDELDGLAQPERGQCGQCGPGRSLVFFAAEGAAQARHVDLHLVHGQPQDAGDGPLDRGGGLGRGKDFQSAVVTRYGQRRLRLQVHMLLAAGVGPAGDHDAAERPGSIHVAHGEGAGRADESACGKGLARVEDGGKRLDVELDQGPGGAAGGRAFGDDQGHRLADEIRLRSRRAAARPG